MLLQSLNSSSLKDLCIKDSNQHAKALGLTGEHPEQALFRVGGYLKKGGAPKDVTAQVLAILSEKCHPPFSIEELQAKVDKAYQAQESQENCLAQEVRELVLSSSVAIVSSSVAKELGLSSRVDMKNLSKALGRLCDEGLLERGKQRGHFRVVDRSEQVIAWQNAEAGKGLSMFWPLNLQERFEILPGSVVMVAGESNAGKTAFLLNVAWMNLARFPPFYFSSSNETNALTLRKRIELFGHPLNEWEPMTAISRPGDFQDVIRPDGLNLVDYLEVHEDFYLIGKQIAAIAAKLRDGVAVIAVQKNPGSDFGRGGAMTLDKATAYLTLHRGNPENNEPHTLKLPKVKYPLVDFASKPIRFKLAGGSRFVRA